MAVSTVRDALGRKVRGYRAHTTAPHVMSERDIEILRILLNHRYARSRFIFHLLPAHIRGNENAVQKRLRTLFDHGYIDWPKPQRLPFAQHNYLPAVWEISEKGRKALQERFIEPEPVDYLGQEITLQFDHAMMLCDTLQSIEIGARDLGIPLTYWPELIKDCPPEIKRPLSLPATVSHGKHKDVDVKIFPDAFIKVGDIHLFIEIENTNRVRCNNLSQTSFEKKFLAYRHLNRQRGTVLKERFGIDFAYILFATPHKAKKQTMMNLANEITEGKGYATALFADIPDFARTPYPEILTTPLERAGREPFIIHEP